MINYLLKNNISNKLYVLGFVVAVITYSAWQPLEGVFDFAEKNKGSIFYIGIAFSFCCYTSAYLFTKWDKWRFFPMFAVFICISRFLGEVYFVFDDDPKVENYEMFDYISFLITIFIVFNYYIKYRTKKFKDENKS